MSEKALQVVSIANEHDAKGAGMDEMLNGGTTSVGAQLRRLEALHPRLVRAPSGVQTRNISFHAVVTAFDFPAAAMGLAAKGSTSAHRYDRKSTIDQRDASYDASEPFSLLHPKEGGFKRLTYAMFHRYLRNALQLSKTDREA